MDAKTLAALRGVVGKDHVLTRREDLLCYSYDGTPDMPEALPAAVVFPSTTAEVRDVVRLAGRDGLAVYPRGAGTNLSGGAIPLCGGLVLSTLRMNRILDLDPDNLAAVVQPGVVIDTLNRVAAPHGLLYPPDPGTVATATMGGSVAECSGGLRGLKYGVTRDYVMGLEVVLGDGRVARFGGKTVKNVTGYDLVRLFTGSEGTLGVITEITVRLIPAPEERATMLAAFGSLADAGKAVSAIIRSRVIPATLEIMDRTTILAVESYAGAGLPEDADAVLLIEVDGVPEAVRREAAAVQSVVRDCGGALRTATNEAERDRLWAARRAALSALARVAPTTVLEDATVPRSRLVEMLMAVQAIAKRHGLRIGTFGHAGDGNLHPTILADARDHAEMGRVRLAVADIFGAALSLGGTLTGEHGIGLAKMRFLPQEIGASGVSVMRDVKRALDPENRFNPGKLLPRPAEDEDRDR